MILAVQGLYKSISRCFLGFSDIKLWQGSLVEKKHIQEFKYKKNVLFLLNTTYNIIWKNVIDRMWLPKITTGLKFKT